MKHYEMLYILPVSYTPDELKAEMAKVEEIVTKNGGQITKKEDLGKLKFAYLIDNMSHGFYNLIEFDLEPEALLKISQTLKLKKDLIRHLIVNKQVKTAEQIEREKAIQAKIAKEQEEEMEKKEEDIKQELKKETKKEEPKSAEKPKVDLEDLDKKLEEILEGKDIV